MALDTHQRLAIHTDWFHPHESRLRATATRAGTALAALPERWRMHAAILALVVATVALAVG